MKIDAIMKSTMPANKNNFQLKSSKKKYNKVSIAAIWKAIIIPLLMNSPINGSILLVGVM